MPDVRMEIFDMAKREVCIARRPLTNTPLQALTLLNEPRFNECARKIASRAANGPPGDPALDTIFRTLTSRHPSDRNSPFFGSCATSRPSSQVSSAPRPKRTGSSPWLRRC